MSSKWKGVIKKISDTKFCIPKDYNEEMKVSGIIFASDMLLSSILEDESPQQVINVATLPGIVKASFAMPDIHYGYGFPIGGVAAFSIDNGVISPGGVGYDINCGCRVLRTDLVFEDIKDKVDTLVSVIYANVPSGVGRDGKIRISENELNNVLTKGAKWAISKGFGWAEDIECTEENGCLSGASPDAVSKRAIERGAPQLGTLGSGNHFIEIQEVIEIFDEKIANVFGLFKGQIIVMIHSGSRGLGYQVCDDYIKIMREASQKYNIKLTDKQLCCAPIKSKEGKDYFSAMASAANYAWANRQCIAHWIRESFEKVLNTSSRAIGMWQIYDVAHNIAKFETHKIDGKEIKVCVHRKGATRSFGPKNKDIPEKYKEVGQPVLIPGDMGRYSYILCGTTEAESECFGSACHGAGRLQSRTQSKKHVDGSELLQELAKKGIIVKTPTLKGLAEEAPSAYKDVDIVVDICHESKIAKKVAKSRPLGVIKG